MKFKKTLQKSMNNKDLINHIEDSINLKKKIPSMNKEISKSIEQIYKVLKNKSKIFICGNGGSAADAQHIAAEFMVRLRPNVNRDPYPVISLALDTSTITACGNDYSFDELFARNLKGLAKKGDLLIAISTSGNSKNILKVLKEARKLNIKSISFLGNKGGKAKRLSDLDITVPSKTTARIQEIHIFLAHYIALQVEKKLLRDMS